MVDIHPIITNSEVFDQYNKQKSEFHFQQRTDDDFVMFLLDTAVRVISIVQHLAPVIEAVSAASVAEDDASFTSLEDQMVVEDPVPILFPPNNHHPILFPPNNPVLSSQPVSQNLIEKELARINHSLRFKDQTTYPPSIPTSAPTSVPTSVPASVPALTMIVPVNIVPINNSHQSVHPTNNQSVLNITPSIATNRDMVLSRPSTITNSTITIALSSASNSNDVQPFDSTPVVSPPLKTEIEPGSIPEVIIIKSELEESPVTMVTKDSPLVTMESPLAPSMIQQLVSSLNQQSSSFDLNHNTNNLLSAPLSLVNNSPIATSILANSSMLLANNAMLANNSGMFGLNKSDRISLPSNLAEGSHTLPGPSDNKGRAEPANSSPVVCQLCGKDFPGKVWNTRLQNLKKHINSVHLKLKPFPCPKCGQSFPAKQNLQNHYRRRHLYISTATRERETSTTTAENNHIEQTLLHPYPHGQSL